MKIRYHWIFLFLFFILLPIDGLLKVESSLDSKEIQFPSFDFCQDESNHYNLIAPLIPLKIDHNCKISKEIFSHARLVGSDTQHSNFLIYINWQQAEKCGCFQFSKIVEQLDPLNMKLLIKKLPPISAAIFSAHSYSKERFGSPISEPWGDYRDKKPQLMELALTSRQAGHELTELFSNHNVTVTARLIRDIGPWNRLFNSSFFQIQRWCFFILGIMNAAYAAYTVVIIFMKGIKFSAPLAVFLAALTWIILSLIFPAEDVAGSMTNIFVNLGRLFGFLAYNLLIISWGRLIQYLTGAKYYPVLYWMCYISLANYFLVTSLIISSFILESPVLLDWGWRLLIFSIPVIFLTQSISLCYFGILFLIKSSSFRFSKQTRNSLRRLTYLTFSTLLAWVAIAGAAITISTDFATTSIGFTTNIILYKTAFLFLTSVIFWVFAIRETVSRQNHFEQLNVNDNENESLSLWKKILNKVCQSPSKTSQLESSTPQTTFNSFTSTYRLSNIKEEEEDDQPPPP